MKKHFVITSLLLLLTTAFLLGCVAEPTLEAEVAPLETRISELELRVSVLELGIAYLEDRIADLEWAEFDTRWYLYDQDLRLDTLIFQLRAAGIELELE